MKLLETAISKPALESSLKNAEGPDKYHVTNWSSVIGKAHGLSPEKVDSGAGR